MLARRAPGPGGPATQPLLVPAFFWKLLSAEGVHPLLDECARCGSAGDADLVAFDLAEGGVLCRACRSGVPISADALALLRRISGGGLAASWLSPSHRRQRRSTTWLRRRWKRTSSAGCVRITVLDRG